MVVDGKRLVFSIKLIVVTTRMENARWWCNQDMKISITKIRMFYMPSNPLPLIRKFAYHIYTIPYPWNKIMQVIMRLFTLKGRYTKLFGVHFTLLNHFKGVSQNNLPFFLFQSLASYIQKNRRATLIHQGLIKILIDFSLLGPHHIHPIDR